MTKVDSGLKKSEPVLSPEQAANSTEDWQRDALCKVIPVRMTPDVETKSAIVQKHWFAPTGKYRTMKHLQNSMAEQREIAARMNYAGTNKAMKLNLFVDKALQTGASCDLLKGVLFDEVFSAFINTLLNSIKPRII